MKGIRRKMKITAEVFSVTKWKQRVVFSHATMMAGSTESFWSCPADTRGVVWASGNVDRYR